MDQTLVSIHTSGAIPRSKLPTLAGALTPASKALIPRLLSDGFRVSVSTLSDDLYSAIYEEKHVKEAHLSGIGLVEDLLKTFLSADQIKAIAKVTLNPQLYPPASEEKNIVKFYRMKLHLLGLRQKPGEKADPAAAERMAAAHKYPPEPHKIQHMAILHALTAIPYRNMILLDDNLENIVECCKRGSYGILVNPTVALQYDDFARISAPGGAIVPFPEQPV